MGVSKQSIKLCTSHELFCALSLNSMLDPQISGQTDRSTSRVPRCLPTIALTKDKTPIVSCAGTDRIVLVFTGLPQTSLIRV